MGCSFFGTPTKASVPIFCGRSPFDLVQAVLWWFVQHASMAVHICRDSGRAGVNMLSGLNATRHPVHKAAKPAPASQTNSAREHSVCAIKPLKSVRVLIIVFTQNLNL